MQKILITSATIIDETSSYHGKVANMLIEDGKIAKIGKHEVRADITLNAKGMILSTGWFDMRAMFGDPGFEHKEDMHSGLKAAAAGGFTGVALMPNTQPVTQTKNAVQYLKNQGSDSPTEVFPIAAITLDTKGEELTEMIDLYHAGAVAFSDGIQPVWHTDILLKSLQYLQKFDGLLINKPEDVRLNLFGTMHEGVNSTMLGMKGMPRLAEELMVQRDLELLEYAGGRIHFANISSEKAVAMIRQARKKGLSVSCDMATYQTAFNDDDLSGFDTNLKVNPPFREESDHKSLIKGLKDGVIEVIVSNHIPQDEESKKLEFDLAEFGVISLQTMAANLSTLSKKVDMEVLIKTVTANPRRLLRLTSPKIQEGEWANLTLFDPAREWELNGTTNFSKARNSPFWKQKLKGKAVTVINKGKYYIDESIK